MTFTYIFDEVELIKRKDNPVTKVWESRAKNLLKAELKRNGVTYARLAELMAAIEVPETERNLANKISRGGFTAAFLLQCLAAIGAIDLRLKWGGADALRADAPRPTHRPGAGVAAQDPE